MVDKGHFDKVRFWGKIFGTQKNYFIAEAEQNTDDGDDDEDDGTEEAQIPEGKDTADDEEFDGEDDPLPKSTYKQPAIIPKEQRGTGVNRYTYYVCNHRMFEF